ncbi:hypothetical protein DFH09DRAFT_1280646 [Mycena vulgaris]|nr:hypothetical protein DFH09DRAFT_1280646 [Mycena vulgaris]
MGLRWRPGPSPSILLERRWRLGPSLSIPPAWRPGPLLSTLPGRRPPRRFQCCHRFSHHHYTYSTPAPAPTMLINFPMLFADRPERISMTCFIIFLFEAISDSYNPITKLNPLGRMTLTE